MTVDQLLTIFVNEANQRELQRYALLLTGHYDNACDLVEDLAIKIYSDPAVQKAREPMAYFKTCMKYAYYNKIRHEKRLQPLPENACLINFHDDWNAYYRDQNARDFVRENLSEYDPKLVSAFEAFYLDGYSQKELAKQLGIKTDTLAHQFKRMRDKLKKKRSLFTLMLILHRCVFR